ncbi:MAG: hypothetical protein RXP86_12020 [Acidilobus sp.]
MWLSHDIIYGLQEKASLHGLIAFCLEVILARQVRVMGDEKKITKRKRSKIIIMLIAPLVALLGIDAGAIYLCIVAGILHLPNINNLFIAFLGLWLGALSTNLLAIYYIHLEKGDLRSPIAKRRLDAIKGVKLASKMAYIITAIIVFGGGLLLASYFVYLRAVALGVTNVSAPMTSQEAVLALLLLISLPIQAYFVRREAIKAIRLGMLS